MPRPILGGMSQECDSLWIVTIGSVTKFLDVD